MSLANPSLNIPQTQVNSEFLVPGEPKYDHRGAVRWLLSHAWVHRIYVMSFIAGSFASYIFYSQTQVLIGEAAGEIVNRSAPEVIERVALLLLGVVLLTGILDLARSLLVETIAQRLEASARRELYVSLLGKSQTFHDRQRAGDIMALATDDVTQLNFMMNPGILFIADMILGFTIPILFIGALNTELLIVPIGFVIVHALTARQYMRQLNPITRKQRMQFAKTNSVAEETISGIEVVKASAAEPYERRRFSRNAWLFRSYFIRQGLIEAKFLPLLLYGLATAIGFFHAASLVNAGRLEWSQLIAYVGLFGALRFPTFVGLFAFTVIQLGIAGSERILKIINTETELDQNVGGHSAAMAGEIVFENVSFGYDDGMVIENVSFRTAPGQTVAIVGQTGSGKSTLTEMINRTYDVTAGRVLVDGIDVREWNLTSLRSQISRIEQDVFLFSRTLAENIAYGNPSATQPDIERAAKEAQAHDFISGFSDGYNTMVGERGVTLSGGQRQRIALARAFLSDPRILILDDSTSAIDSATEDEIQKAIRRAQEGRTTLLITHRLSQIRWADHILVLEGGHLVAAGSHESLLRRSSEYRRIFARYDLDLPPLEAETA